MVEINFFHFKQISYQIHVVLTQIFRSFSGDPYCPVQLYKTYAQQRPVAMRNPESPFYLGINRQGKPESPWYICAGMGKNTIGSIAKTMSMKAGLMGRHTNHSGRKTTVTKLVEKNIPVNEIMQLTGHKNVKSINDYSTANIQKQQEMSSAISTINRPRQRIENTLRAIENFENSTASESSSTPFLQGVESEPDYTATEEQVTVVERNNDIDEQNSANLPLISSPGGSLSVQFAQNSSNRFYPQSVFHGCSFHAPVTISMIPQ